jgi:hypothetical protein
MSLNTEISFGTIELQQVFPVLRADLVIGKFRENVN